MKTFPKNDVDLFKIFKPIYVHYDGYNFIASFKQSLKMSREDVAAKWPLIESLVEKEGYKCELDSISFRSAYCKEHKSTNEIRFTIS